MTNIHSNSAFLTLPVNLNGFEALEDESRKVLFVENLLLHEKLLPNYETLNLFERKKSTELSHTYRDIGNEHFRNRKFFSALCCYNKSLCFGNSPDVALTFANRSAIYLEIGEFELCLQNIQKARENNYPADKALKLEKREKLCTKKRVEKCLVKRNFLPRMKHAPNANYPFFIECLQLERNDEYGRHILTRDNLNAGDVIVDERPFCAMLLANCCYKRCSNCLAQYHLNLIPCPNCCSAMFCSEKCLQSANKKFHRFECGISQSNFDLYFTKQTTIALRTFYEALNICGNSIEELKILFNESNCAEFTAFDLNIKDCNFKKMYFNVINSLCTNQEFRRSDDVLCRYATAIILHDFLIKHSSLKNIIESDVNKSFFIRAIFKLTQIAESNFHELYALAPNKERQMNEQFGIGCYGFASLLSHSCSPNVVRITFNGSNYIIATRKIYKGEQIFDNYGYHHTFHSLMERREMLRDRYQFFCKCDACLNDFPRFENLREFDKEFDQFISKDVDDLENFMFHEAMKHLILYLKYINEHTTEIPCYEITLLQECALRCFQIFEKYQSNFNRMLIEGP